MMEELPTAECVSCGEDTLIEDMTFGKCPTCEDQQMVRGIR